MEKIEKIKDLTRMLLYYSHNYYALDKSEISDELYDKMYDELKMLEDETGFYLANSPTHRVQGEVLPFLQKVKHSVPMLSADKSTDIADVKKFIGNKDIIVSFKLDGGTVVCKYSDGKLVQALTRGSGEEGEDITHTAKMIKNLPMIIPYTDYLEVRGEALIPWKYYEEMNDSTLGHPRNVATGGLRQLDANEAAKRNIYFYAFTLVNWEEVGTSTKWDSLKFLSDNGFDVVPHLRTSNETLDKKLDLLDRSLYDNPTDGWCFEYDDLAYGESLGSTGHHDRRLFALKPERETYETTLKTVEFTMGKTGALTPTAVFEPTTIENTVIERASVHNISIMKSLNMSIGAKIEIYKSNMIIPQVFRTIQDGDSPIEIPTKCPICGAPTKIVKENDSEVLMCTNPSCGGKLLGQLAHFVSKKAMDIRGLSESTLETLISHKFVNNYLDIYHLSDYYDQLINLDGFGKKSVDNLLVSIEKSRNVDLAHFICALNIPNCGISSSKCISTTFSGDYQQFLDAIVNGFDFTSLPDFGDTTNNAIYKWAKTNAIEATKLANEMHFIKEEKNISSSSQFIGKTLCVTGRLNSFTRDSINEKIESLGAKAASSVSKKTDWLITNETSGSSKYKKAVELGVPIISEDEFIKIIGE